MVDRLQRFERNRPHGAPHGRCHVLRGDRGIVFGADAWLGECFIFSSRILSVLSGIYVTRRTVLPNIFFDMCDIDIDSD